MIEDKINIFVRSTALRKLSKNFLTKKLIFRINFSIHPKGWVRKHQNVRL
jgi:hypothetical protein